FQPADTPRLARTDSRLRTVESFISAETNEMSSVLQSFSGRRLVLGYSKLLGRDNRSASQILDERDALFSREGNEFRRKRGFHKTAHEEIAAMNFENESCVGPNCFRVIVERGLICRADLAQSRPGRLDNFADAKAAADLDQFAARDYNFRFVPGKMPNNQHQRRRAIIDNSGRFCSAQQCERLLD